MPAFTAHASVYDASRNFQSEAIQGFGNGTSDNQVQMQKPNTRTLLAANALDTLLVLLSKGVTTHRDVVVPVPATREHSIVVGFEATGHTQYS